MHRLRVDELAVVSIEVGRHCSVESVEGQHRVKLGEIVQSNMAFSLPKVNVGTGLLMPPFVHCFPHVDVGLGVGSRSHQK